MTVPNEIIDLINNLSLNLESDLYGECLERIQIIDTISGCHLYFYGDPFGESFEILAMIMKRKWTISRLKTLNIDGPDEGANGTKNWNLDSLFNHGNMYEGLRSINVQVNKPNDHNRIIIANSYDEDGMIARAVNKCPNLLAITMPSAPNGKFFDENLNKLQNMSIECGYNGNEFIKNIIKSKNITSLKSLAWADFNETYLDNWKEMTVPYEDYDLLFKSELFNNIKVFELKNSILDHEQLLDLKKIRPRLQFKVINSQSKYIA